MKKYLAFLTLVILALGAGLSCSSNNPTSSAPPPTFTPTLTPCGYPGNTCTPTATPTDTATITPGPFTVSGPTTLNSGGYAYTTVDFSAGQTLFINGAVTMDISNYFDLPSGAAIVGNGEGYPAKMGPGTSADYGGGGHGGAGGNSGNGLSDGGPENDAVTNPSLMGSGGGGAGAGSGGGFLKVNVLSGPASLNGFISMNGNAGAKGANETGSPGGPGSGGGAGGAVYVQAVTIVFNGTLEANGGNGGGGGSSATGGSYSNSTGGNGGGGGGGGIIWLMYHTPLIGSGEIATANGGAAGVTGTGNTAGQPGVAGNAGSVAQTMY